MPFQLERSPTFVVSRLASLLQEQFNRELSVLDISWSQWLVIQCLATKRADTPASIASTLGINRSAVTRLLDRLAHKGLIERMDDPGDKRSVKVRISDPGLLLVDYMESAAQQHEDAVLQKMGEECFQELSKFLSQGA